MLLVLTALSLSKSVGVTAVLLVLLAGTAVDT